MNQDRRRFLYGSAAFIASNLRAAGGRTVRINVDAERVLGSIPANFVGLGYEISSVARPGLLSAKNALYVQLVRTLGTEGVIRIGGNTSDYSSFAPDGTAVSAPKGTVVNKASLQELGTFLDATGWKLIWGLNLGTGTQEDAVNEAQAVASVARDKLLAFEIGNEPDLFGHGKAHRPAGYGFADYLQEYRRFKAAIRAKLPNAPFAGPDAAAATDWVSRFAAEEGNDSRLLTHHYYRECANPASTFEKLLYPDPKLTPQLEKLKAAAASSHVPYRICETNSFCGGGKPGVSDAFGAALWMLDYMFNLASADAAGVNIETGVNQLGFISSYSPIGDDERGAYSAKPAYYGMLAFAQGSRGQRVALDHDAQGVNLSAYAVRADQGRVWITIINKDASVDANVVIAAKQRFSHARAMRLMAASLQANDGVTLAGSAVDTRGVWKPTHLEPLRASDGRCEIHVPAAAAALVVLQP